MNQTTYKINTDIVSTTMKDKPLIFISEEAINLKRDNDNLKSIIKEVREYIEKSKSKLPLGINDFTCEMVYSDEVVLANELLEILDKVGGEQ